MRAAIIRAHGGLEQVVVGEVGAPSLSGPSDVRVRLHAAALNHLDLLVVRGLPGVPPRFPHLLGADGCGTVAEVGPAVTRWRPGHRVMLNPGISCYACEFCLGGEHSLCVSYGLLGEHLPGTLAEEIVVPQHNLAPLPADRSWAEGAAFSLVSLTAWRMLVRRAAVRPGEWVLIWGIGGGVSQAALQIAKMLGAVTIATSSSDEKLERARALGADHVLNHRAAGIAQEVRRLTDRRGVDVVIDNVGEATWAESLRALARGGRLVTCGATTGPSAVSDLRRVFWNQYTIMGSTMGSATEYAAVARLFARGHLVPVVDATYPLEGVRQAFARLGRGEQFGKIVVEIKVEGGG